MSEPDPAEATRREFDAVMRHARFATIDQVAAGLWRLADDERAESLAVTAAPPAATTSAASALPVRRTAR